MGKDHGVTRGASRLEQFIHGDVVGARDHIRWFAARGHLPQQVDTATGEIFDLNAGLARERLLDRRERSREAPRVVDDQLLTV